MATVVNNPSNGSNSTMSFVLGLVLILVIGVFLVYFGLPLLRQSSAPQISVPDQIDVNVNPQGQQGQPTQ